eukprot:3923316-Heterocapsa_arctica.AAC.1
MPSRKRPLPQRLRPNSNPKLQQVPNKVGVGPQPLTYPPPHTSEARRLNKQHPTVCLTAVA